MIFVGRKGFFHLQMSISLFRRMLLAVALVFSACNKRPIGLESSRCNLPQTIFREVSAARGLFFNNTVECRYETPEQMRKYLLDALWKKNPLEKLLFEGDLYHALGFIPADYSYLERVSEFFSQEITGYYKAEDGSYVMRYGSDPVTELDTMRHELTHALQDQHYDIEVLLAPELTTDTLLARTAILEGDADRVMLGLRGVNPCAELDDLALPSGYVGGVPPALRLFLNFPYIYGRRFWCAVEKVSINPEQVMKNLPQSSREVLHPELYLSESEQLKGVRPAVEPDPRFGMPIYHDVIGEFGALALLATYLPLERARAAAWGLLADRAWVFKELNPESTSIVWKSVWQSPEKARDFERALVTASKLRFKLSPSVVEVGGVRMSYFNVGEQGLDYLSVAHNGAVVEVAVLTHGAAGALPID